MTTRALLRAERANTRSVQQLAAAPSPVHRTSVGRCATPGAPRPPADRPPLYQCGSIAADVEVAAVAHHPKCHGPNLQNLTHTTAASHNDHLFMICALVFRLAPVPPASVLLPP
jgi:hypothetical protein